MVNRFLGLALSAVIGTAGADTVYVSLEKDNALAVLGVSGAVKKTLPLGKRPRGLSLSADHARLYVADSDDNQILVLDAQSLATLDKLTMLTDPKTFAVSPDGRRLFASDDDHHQLAVVDLPLNKLVKQIPVGEEPEGVSISPDGRWVVSTSEAAGQAYWIDTQSLEVADKTAVGAKPRYSRFSDDGQQLWVAAGGDGSVAIIDTASRKIRKTLKFQVPGIPQDQITPAGIRIDRQGRFGYVALGRANRVAVVDAEKLELLGYVEVGRRVWNLEFSPDQKRLYAANGLSNDLSIIDLDKREVLKTVPLGQSPWGVAVLP